MEYLVLLQSTETGVELQSIQSSRRSTWPAERRGDSGRLEREFLSLVGVVVGKASFLIIG
jgi:hypothetical protein